MKRTNLFVRSYDPRVVLDPDSANLHKTMDAGAVAGLLDMARLVPPSSSSLLPLLSMYHSFCLAQLSLPWLTLQLSECACLEAQCDRSVGKKRSVKELVLVLVLVASAPQAEH